MTNDEFTAWLARIGLTKAQAAKALGVSTSYVTLLTQGARPITDSLAEACDRIEHNPPAGEGPPAPCASYDEPIVLPASIEARLNAAEDAIQTILARMAADYDVLDKWHTLFKGHLSQLGERVRKIETRSAPLSESDIGMIARRGALTDDEREEAERARRMIAKARTLAAGEPWE